ncbi:MAG: hypothetical protein QF797_15055, partial [Alphaproteobacteria bacterium]|nr:hypothetical protein [Alphaproteobacteria bacterium]
QPGFALELSARALGVTPVVSETGDVDLGGYVIPGAASNILTLNFDGRPGAQVSTDGSVLAGFRGIVAAAPDDLYDPLDRLRIKLLLADKYRAWKYPLPGWADSRLLKGLVFLLWPLPFRMERRIWQAGRPWTAAKVLAALREYMALRRDVMGWWWRDRQNRVPAIKLL